MVEWAGDFKEGDATGIFKKEIMALPNAFPITI